MAAISDYGAAARAWLKVDPDPDTRAELESLLSRRAPDREAVAAALADRFGDHLRFGTAGLRGALGGGPNRMNRVVVRRAISGIMATLPAGATIVIGFDARRNSEQFAADTAAIVAGRGGRAIVLPGPLPTPVLAFSVRYYGAHAGVMVTASHNPAGDNGYKVYLADGAQLIPPHDAQIEQAILAEPLPPKKLPKPRDGGRIDQVGDEIIEAYLDRVLEDFVPVPGVADLKVAYTALHGVAYDVVRRALARVGIEPVPVPSQRDPDPRFPTVAFPNPEEPGAMDAVVELAGEIGADIALANDPDGDRLCVAVPIDGHFRVLRGDELGVLLGDYRLRTTSGSDRLVVSTVVSSSLLGKLAAAAGVHYVETLTGFKWVVRPAIEDPTLHFVFGYEEALGYAVHEAVRDKDGITAALAAVNMTALWRSAGLSLLDRLEELGRAFGHHLTGSASVRFEGPSASGSMSASMLGLRAHPPLSLAGREVVEVIDYLHTDTGLPPTDLLRFVLADGSRAQIRPSGTEPKLKVYVELVLPPGEDLPTDAAELLDALVDAALGVVMSGAK
jgi:phosphomannomutase